LAVKAVNPVVGGKGFFGLAVDMFERILGREHIWSLLLQAECHPDPPEQTSAILEGRSSGA
jgi:hypothetical protein